LANAPLGHRFFILYQLRVERVTVIISKVGGCEALNSRLFTKFSTKKAFILLQFRLFFRQIDMGWFFINLSICFSILQIHLP
jgi:hypothetical protein